MPINPHRRLQSETYSIELPIGEGYHHIDVSIARDNFGSVREIAFVGRGKAGTHLDQMLLELGIAVSRSIQRRSAETGAPLTD